ncbi:MAG: bifunctional tetrahydrofolate synthase/dihydrofolate synthase [Gammaproteobacteria bacterium]|nr:bifunctional tetrahydrofolate synthase/dihydrofolate synthase [Gammaproteobacteria bacterium]
MRFSTLQGWLDWQASLHPSEIELGLDRVAEVWRRLNPEQFSSVVITIAGTNGKGSSAALLESILLAAGYTVGCYTSPHLLRYNERIRVNGLEATDRSICDSFDRVDQARGGVTLTYFEFGTLAALDIFFSGSLDVIILEVGLGGRLDAVNILDPDVALITSIDIDHTEWLGETREDIALEKAGILRAGMPAVFGGDNPPDALFGRASELGVELCLAGREFRYNRSLERWSWMGRDTSYSGLPNPGTGGQFIYRNCSAVLMVLEQLQGRLPLTSDAIKQGLRQLHIPGRFQRLPGPVEVILDVAHNAEASRELAVNLGEMGCSGRTLALFSALADKAIPELVLPLIGLVDRWYIGEVRAERAASLDQLEQAVVSAGVDLSSIDGHADLSDAITKAMADLGTHDRLIVFGSFYTVAETMQHPDIVSLAK